MALGDDIKNSSEEFKKLNQIGEEFKSNLNDITKEIQSQAKSGGDLAGAIQEAARNLNGYKGLADNLSSISKKTLKSKKDLKDIDKKIYEISQRNLRIQSKIKELDEKRANASDKERAALEATIEKLQDAGYELNQLVKGYEEVKNLSEKISKSNPFKPISDFFSDIPILNKFLNNIVVAGDKYNDVLVETGNRQKALKAGWGEYSKLISKATAALTIGFVRKGILYADEASVQLGRSLNLSADAATNLDSQLNDVASNVRGITGLNLKQSLLDFNKEFGLTFELSSGTLSTMSKMTKFLGLSAQESNKLALSSASIGGDLEKQTKETIGQVLVQNAQNNTAVDYKAVLKDIANASAAIRVSIQGTGKSLANAVYEARKLGLSLNQVESIAESLLNFEQSITNELKAELLLGQNLNLETARLAALNNDMATVAQEISKQGITQAKFSKMNAIQQKAIAEALGMSKNDLAESLEIQSAQEKLAAQGFKAGAEQTAEIKRRLSVIRNISDLQEQEKARAALINELGSEALVQQTENQSLSELQAEAAQKMIEAFDYLKAILTPIKGIIKGIANNAGIVSKVLLFLSGAFLLRKVGLLAKLFKSMSLSSLTMSRSMNTVGGVGGKAYGPAGPASGGMMFGPNMSKMSNMSKMGKMGSRFLKASPYAFIGGLAAEYAGGALKESGYEGAGKAVSVGGSALSGAATGAMLGSMVGPIGTAVGGIIGGLYGGISSAMGEYGGEETQQSNIDRQNQTERRDFERRQETQMRELIQATRANREDTFGRLYGA